MTVGDLTASHCGQVLRIDGLPPRVIISVRHFAVKGPQRTAPEEKVTSVIYSDPRPDAADMCSEIVRSSDTPAEVRSA